MRTCGRRAGAAFEAVCSRSPCRTQIRFYVCMERVQDVQADCLADDIEIEAAMVDWSDGELRDFFETGGVTRPVAANENSGSSATVRLYAISDLHWDYQKNRTWLDALPAGAHRSDAIILAGDITHVCADLESCLRRFKAIFGEVLHAHMRMQTTRTQHAPRVHAHALAHAQVLYTPGNHELWVKRADVGRRFADSVEAALDPTAMLTLI